jgi:membrane fusion protein, multidrug efflux system
MVHKTTYSIVCALLLFAGCRQKNVNTSENPVAAIPVQTEQVKTVTTNDEISISGNIEGNTTVRLGFMVAGKIDFISINEGENILKGQIVASLDPSNYNIAKEMADVQVNAVTDEFNRLKLMHDRNSISDGDFSKISFSLQQVKVQQKLHEKNLTDTKLYAPISGVLLKKLTEAGEIVGVGIPLFVISDISRVKVIAYIPEGELHNITLGQSATVIISSLSSTYKGKVIEVGSAADVTSRAFTVKIELQNPHLLIRPGMIAEVRLPSTSQREMMLLPAEAILRDPDKQSYVFVVDARQNKAFKRKISIGPIIDNKVAITSGLTNGETVVTSGQTKLNDASLISIIK